MGLYDDNRADYYHRALRIGHHAYKIFTFYYLSREQACPQIRSVSRKGAPAAIFSMLVVYCLKNVNLTAYSFGIPELIGIISVVGLHLWKRQMILSIAGGTVIYMLLVQLVF